MKYIFIFFLVIYISILGVTLFIKNPKLITKKQIPVSTIAPNKTVTVTPVKPRIINKPTTNPVPTTAPTPIPAVNKTDQCIVTINGQKYNITDYINQHPGGNTFDCGTDMSAAFSGQHPDSYLKKIAKYKATF